MSEDQPTDISDEALAFIVRIHSGTATRADRDAFAIWRAQSAAHEAAAHEAEAIWGDTADLYEDDRSRTVQPGRKSRKPGGGTLAGLALVVALGAAGGAYVEATGGLETWMADVATSVGTTRALTLADGSRVLLNAESAIDVAMSPGARSVTLLRGEAFFEVAADRTRPFAVTISGSTVTARGTAFDIARHADGAVDVAVTDHAVALAPRVGRSADLAAGRGATIASDGTIGSLAAIDASAVTAWREGLLVAENQPLDAIVARLRAYHRGWIVIRDPALARLRVNAVLDLRAPATALQTLAKGLPINVSTLSPFVILIAPR